MRLLVIGKPRSGKSVLSKNLAVKLDLVHVSVENWLATLLAKIKAYEPPELEEGQEPPKWLSDLEEAVHKALQSG
jgi:adenylate kinase family enzyme